MIVDGKGNLFENRRKNKEDRRKNEIDVPGGRRKEDRRKSSQIPRNRKKEKIKTYHVNGDGDF